MDLTNIVNDNDELKKEREELASVLASDSLIVDFLSNHNIPKELVNKFPMKFNRLKEQLERCDNCKCLDQCKNKDKGYRKLLVYDNSLKEIIVACDFRKKEIAKEKQIKKENPHLAYYMINDLPEDTKNVKLENIDVVNERNPKYIDSLKEIKLWLNGVDSKGLYLYGDVGVGKTYLAACISNKFAKDGKRIVFIHMPSYLVRLKKAFDDYSEYEYLINSCLSCDVLVLDDIGAEPISSWYRDEILLPILNTRMNERKLTVFTSNLTIEQLEEKFKYTKEGQDDLAAQRLTDRIRVLAKPLLISGKNRRID